MKRICTLMLFGLLLASGASHANPANCDDDMTEAQLEERKACTLHVGCGLVYKVFDSCVAAKKFLSQLKPHGKELTDDEVVDALESSSDAPRSTARQCIVDLNLGKCKELLGIGPDKVETQQRADAIAERLNSSLMLAKVGKETQDTAVHKCQVATSQADKRDVASARKWCDLAEWAIKTCNSGKSDYEDEAEKLLKLTNSGKLANATVYRNVANKPYPECPTTLPSGKTPKEALADFLNPPEEKQAKQDETLSKDKVREMLDPCTAAKYDPDHAADYAAACKRKKEAEGQVEGDPVLTRRSGYSNMLEGAVGQAEKEEQGRSSRDALRKQGEQAKADEQQRLEQMRAQQAARDREQAAREQAVRDQRSRESWGAAINALGVAASAYLNAQAQQQQQQQQQQYPSGPCDLPPEQCPTAATVAMPKR